MKRSKILPAIKMDQHHHGWNGSNKSIVEYVEFFETSKRKEAKSKEKVSNILMLAWQLSIILNIQIRKRDDDSL